MWRVDCGRFGVTMTRIAVFEGRIDLLADFEAVHACARAAGVSELQCAFRDSRDAALAVALFREPSVTVLRPEAVSGACIEASMVLRRGRRGGIIVVEGGEREAAADARAVLPAAPVVAQVVIASDLESVIADGEAPFVHVLTPDTRIGAGYARLCRAVGERFSPDEGTERDVTKRDLGPDRCIAVPARLLRSGKGLDLTFLPMSSRQSSHLEAGLLENALGLTAACRLVRRDAFVKASAGVRDGADILALFGLGGVFNRPDRVLTAVDIADAVLVEIGQRHAALYRFAQMGAAAADMPRHFGQARALLASPDAGLAVRTLLRREAILQTLERGLPITVFGNPLLNHLQFVADAVTELGPDDRAERVLEALSDLLADADAQVQVIAGEGDDPFVIDLNAALSRDDYIIANPMAAVRTGSNDPRQLFEDATTEGVPDAVIELARQPALAWPLERVRLPRLRAAIEAVDDPERLIARLVDGFADTWPGQQATVDRAMALQDQAEWLLAACAFAALHAQTRDATHLAGVVFNLAYLGRLGAARGICRHALDIGGDANLLLDVLFDVATPPTLNGEPMQPWLTEQAPRFRPSHWERYIHRLLDGGEALGASAMLKRRQMAGTPFSTGLRLRVLRHLGDWRAVVAEALNSDLPEREKACEVAEALAQAGQFEAAVAHLRSTDLPKGVVDAQIATLMLRSGREDEGFELLKSVARTEARRDVYGAKRMLVSEWLFEGQTERAQDAVRATLDSDIAWDVKLFVVARFMDGNGLPRLAARFYRHVVTGLVSPNWFRVLNVWLLHRSLHFSARHAEALALIGPLLNDNGPFGAVFDEEFKLLRQTMLILNGLRWAGSLRAPTVRIVGEQTLSDVDAQHVLDVVAESRRERPDAIVLLLNFQTGDAYLVLYALRQLAETRGLKSADIVIVCSAKLRGVVSMFADVVGSIVETQFDNMFVLHRRLCETGLDGVFLAHPEFLSHDAQGAPRVGCWRLDFLVQSKQALGLHPDHAGDHPRRAVVARRLRPAPRAFLAPMSNSFRLLPGAFWQALADRLGAMGWEVFVNKGPEGEQALAGAKPIDLPHAQLVGFLDEVDCVIGLRSGLLDVVSGTLAPMIVYYPVPGLNMPWLHMWSLKCLRRSGTTDEIPLLFNEYDEAQLVDDTVRRALALARKMKT